MTKDTKSTEKDVCPKCGSSLAEITTTRTGKQLQRCSTGSWDPDTRSNVGCDYVKWIEAEPQTLDEKCPKCEANLVLSVTRFGKKMKKCSTAGWDSKTRTASGCPYIQWLKVSDYPQINNNGGEEFLPPEPQGE